jgi:hypothetical protein
MATLTMQEVQNVRRVLQEAATLRHKVARLESLLASLADEVATLTAKKHNVHGVEKNNCRWVAREFYGRA